MNFKILGLLAFIPSIITLKIHDEEPPKPTLPLTSFYTNLEADNWINGDKDQQELNRQLFKNVIKQSSAGKCPLRKPFTTDGKSCFQCPLQYPIYNLSKEKCQRCPKQNKIVDHKCA